MPDAAGRAPWRVLPENPFVGLRPFSSAESLVFFGRGTQTLELLDRLHDSRFVAVVGSSGCGKSSLVRAGLIPSLKAGFLVKDIDRWTIAAMKPGETPLYSLAAALTQGGADERAAAEALLARIRESGLAAVLDHIRASAAGGNFLLLVDQFEEIFSSVKRDATPKQIDDAVDFVSLMLRLAEQRDVAAYVVMSMRTDFLGDCDAFFGLPEALNRSQYLVPRLTRQQRREVIEGPISLYRKEIQPELLDRMLNDAGERSDQLPVLQHALMRTWQEFLEDGGDEVGLSHYEACGGIAEALNRHAEQAMEGMTAAQVRLTERIFRELADTDERGRRIRRRMLLSQLVAITGASADEIRWVIDRFQGDNRAFLVVSETEVPGDQRIDVSHEALFRQWKRLERWVEAEAQSKEDYLRLVQSARLHNQGKEGLLRDPALTAAEQWRAREDPTESWAARYGGDFHATLRYLDTSRRERQAEYYRRRRRIVLRVFGTGLVAGSLVILLQAWKNERAAVFRSALSAEDPLVRALAVAELGYSGSAEQAVVSLQQAAAAAIPLAVLGEREPQTPNPALIGAWFDSGGNRVATVSKSGDMRRWPHDGQGNPDAVKIPVKADLSAIAVSRDRQWIAAGLQTGEGWIARSDGSRVADFNVPGARITALAFSPDGGRILAGYQDYTVRIWTRDGTLARVVLGDQKAQHTDPVSSVQFDPVGKRALTASWDGTARIWNLDTGKSGAVLAPRLAPRLAPDVAPPPVRIDSAGFSPDGRWVICGYEDGLALIWRSDGTGPSAGLEGHRGAVSSVSFSPDGSKVVTGSRDQSARIWNLSVESSPNLESPEMPIVIGSPTVLIGHTGAVSGVAFNDDGSKIVTVSEDGTARVWWSESREPQILGKHEKRVQSVAFSPDGKKVLSSSDDKTARVWNLDGSHDPQVYTATSYVRSVAFNSDGTKVVAGSEDGIFCIWNLVTNARNFRQEQSDVLSVAFSPDGARIVTGTRQKEAEKLCCVRMWSLDDSKEPYEQLPASDGHSQSVWHAGFSRDGSSIVTACQDKTARILAVDREHKALVSRQVLTHANRVLSATFSPDDSRVATASADRARIWNLNAPTPTVLREFPHADEVWQVVFNSDGKWLLTTSLDKTVKLWGAEENPHLVLSHPSGVRSAAFRPPGDSYVVTGAEDGWVRLWRTKARDLVDYLRAASTACLTPRQRVSILGESEKKARSGYNACEAGHGRTVK